MTHHRMLSILNVTTVRLVQVLFTNILWYIYNSYFHSHGLLAEPTFYMLRIFLICRMKAV